MSVPNLVPLACDRLEVRFPDAPRPAAAVESVCDDVVLLERGRVLAAGRVTAVVAVHAPAAEQTLEGAYAQLVAGAAR